jgi:uncharacterized protein (TIGR00730 family)
MSYQYITVFGSARPKPGDSTYRDGVRLGGLLAHAGYTVLTGGYMGTMEAVSRGAAEAGGHVVGITCDELETYRPVSHNRWVTEEKRFPRLRDRLLCLIDECDAALALPGGAGTLAEVSMMWNHLLIKAISPRPLILIGSGWKTIFDACFNAMAQYVGESERSWLSFAGDVDSAFHLLQSGQNNPEN